MLIDPKLSHYLNEGPTEGIIRIYNLQSDKSLLVKSNDIIKDIKNIRFTLDLGMYKNTELQESYAKIGLELFALDPYKILEKNSEKTLDELLLESKEELLKKNVTFF
jgi:hypothetical protein